MIGARTPSPLEGRASHGAADIPCAVHAVPAISDLDRFARARGWEFAVVAVLPLMDVPIDLALRARDASCPELRTRVSPSASKALSRLFTLRHPRAAAALRASLDDLARGEASLALREVWPQEPGSMVLRFKALFPTDDPSAALEVSVLDAGARAVDATPIVMEDHVVPARDAGCFNRLISFSMVLPESTGTLCLSARLAGADGQRAFTTAYAGVVADMLGHSRWLATGGAAGRDYARWFDRHRATSAQLARQRERALACKAPVFSIVVPVFDTPPDYLRACIDSVLRQSWPHWELILVNARAENQDVKGVLDGYDDDRISIVAVPNRSIAENTNAGIALARGSYVAFLDHDDVLEPDALWWYAQVADDATDLIYCDEDRLSAGSYVNPAFKAGANITHLYAHNYVTHFLAVSRFVLENTERTPAELSGAQDYDLTLKAFEVGRKIRHVPRVLYHWREHAGSTAAGSEQKPFAVVAGRRALERHFERRGLAATVEDGRLPGLYQVTFDVPRPEPLVSVIIPSKDNVALLRRCITSILERSTYPNLEIVVMENNSSDRGTFDYYDEVARDGRVRVATWSAQASPSAPCGEGGFNYSAIINEGARQAKGAVLVLLNNDTEVIAPRWLEVMLGQLARPEVGVVGAKLLFEDGLVQHAGMVANGSGDFAHVNRNLAASEAGYAFSASTMTNYSMVTGACQMVSRPLFEELRGYDEQLAVGFNDGDFCLSVREAGYQVVYEPAAVLMHREFSTRGREADDPSLRARYVREKAYIMRKHPAFFAGRDPAVNPNLSRYSDWWELA